MNKKGVSLVIIGVVIVAVVVIGVVAYWALTNTGGEENPTPTPTPTPTSGIADATSLQFDVSTSEKDVTFQVKNLGTSEILMRVGETYSDGSSFVYIMDQAEQKAWANFDGSWTDVSSDFSTYWDTWQPSLNGYVAELANWSGTGDYEIQAGGETQTISNIVVNPTLADSLFQPD
jgi:FlaG/FlaF family flagellin (archaellin)